MKRKSSDLTEFYIQFLIVVYLLWSFPVLSFGQKEVLVPADGTVSEGEEQPVVALTFDDGPSGTSTPVLLEGLRKRGGWTSDRESYISSCKSVENVSRTGTGRTGCNG